MVQNEDEVFIQYGGEGNILHGFMLQFYPKWRHKRHKDLQYEVGVAKRIGTFCPSDSVRPTDRLHSLNVFTCHVINHFKQKATSKRNLEELRDA